MDSPAPRIVTAEELRARVTLAAVIEPVRQALIAHSQGTAATPPIGLIELANGGEVHVKSGYLHGSRIFLVKVATMVPANRARGIDTSDGLMAAFSADTGRPLAILHDRKWLTDLRTAAVGAIATDALARPDATGVAVLGTGGQAHLRVHAVALVRPIRRVTVWGRDPERASALAGRLARELPAVSVTVAPSAEVAVRSAAIVVTATASRSPILRGAWLTAGQHVTAVGADDTHKRELDAEAFARADRVIVDGRDLNRRVGDLAAAIGTGRVTADRIDGELGELLSGRATGRTARADITIAKQVGLGVEDAAVALAALSTLET